jgi:flagellar basal body-associated protein FliL
MRDPDGPNSALLRLYRVLAAIALGLVLAIAAGTVYGLASGRRPAPPAAPQAAAPENGYFTGIGRIRAASAGASPSAVIVSIAFTYDRNDIAFSEELAAKTKAFREIAVAYFGTFTAAALREAGEPDLKAELLKRFNRELRLGQIEELYFSEYLVLD